MNRKTIIGPSAVAVAVILSGCAPVQALDTAALRTDAVREELDLIADAVSSFDASAIEHLQCEQPRLIELPRSDDLPSAVTLPLHVEVGEVEALDLSVSTYTDPDPDAEFRIASLRERGIAPDREPVLLPDVIVRVDDREACLWAMGPPFAVLMGL